MKYQRVDSFTSLFLNILCQFYIQLTHVQITAPKDITILMSAIRSEPEPHPSDGGKLVYQFEQKFPVCTYLIAIVGGDLVSRYM